jgi:hypothetical protein
MLLMSGVLGRFGVVPAGDHPRCFAALHVGEEVVAESVGGNRCLDTAEAAHILQEVPGAVDEHV